MLNQLRKYSIVPVVAVENVSDGVALAETLTNSGLEVVEITFRTTAAAEVIKEVTNQFPNLLVGAGTVLTKKDLDKAISAGSKFAVAPGCNTNILKYALENKFSFFPGVATPSDMESALEVGCNSFKFFPAEAAGGVKMLQALIGPYRHLGVQFMPTGGITVENMNSYLALPEIVAVGGTWIANSADIQAGHWAKIAENIKNAKNLLAK